ncbi:hypothetical protein [Bradyrhizobium cenepequi]|uniref:hypothetical protein n=1 Tax=Bradyrhizobium cenepequi TaxID=2821403 RepID=UPI001CE388C3|nr:hypothetical protein [Bradyrhizobium cenepequi]MCA6108147.1 hypothetical protein [Bradyrhizobium cenepequi]
MNILEAPTVGDLIEALVERGLRVRDAHDAIARAMTLAPPRSKRKPVQSTLFPDGAPTKPRKVKHRWPEGFSLTADRVAYAADRGFTPQEIARMWTKFQNGAHANAREYADWPAAWRTWVERDVEYRQREAEKNGAREVMDRRY